MDIEYLKIRIDIKTEHDEYKKKFEYRKKEIKKEEVKKIFEDFKDFFKEDGNFKFRENEHSVTAEYKDHGITLDIDVYKTLDNKDFNIEGFIKTFENEIFEFEAEAICNKEPIASQHVSGQEKLLHDTGFYKGFDKGEIFYTFKYRLKGREQKFDTIQELMHHM